MSRLWRALVVVSVLLLGQSAHAVLTKGYGYYGNVGATSLLATQQAAADRMMAFNAGQNPAYTYTYGACGPWLVSDSTRDYCVLPVTEKRTSTGATTSLNQIVYRQANALCPVNSAGTTTCTCNSGYVDTGKNSCGIAATCTPGATQSSGYYDIGTSPAGSPPMGVCSGGCLGTFDGTSPSGSSLVGGVKHWYAKGKYVNFGSTCDSGNGSGIVGGTGTAPTAASGVPSDTCAARDAMGTVNGVKTCVNQANASGTTTAPPVPSTNTQSTTSTTTTNSADNSTTTTSVTTNTNSDGSTGTTTTTTVKNADGSIRSSNTVKAGSTDGPAASTSTTPDTGSDACTKNSSAEGCGGTPSDVDSSQLYTPKDKTVATILTNAKTTLQASPAGAAVTGFFNVSGGGSCPASVWNLAYFNRSYTFDAYCSSTAANMMLVIKGVLLLVASFMAFRVAIE